MAQMQKLGKTATKVVRGGKITEVVFHSTCVVRFYDNTVVLDSGGWRTATTKVRMNQASNQFHLGFQVYQVKGEWFVDTRIEKKIPFYDGMTFLG